MSQTVLKVLYICYLSLDDPLTHTQVTAYLRGLATRGHRIHLLTFEPAGLSRSRRQAIRRELAAQGITWHWLRYHKRPSLPATIFDVAAGALVAGWLVGRFRLNAIHARSHVPAAMALITRRLRWWSSPGLIFDIRGLMAEEYEDAGRWQPGGVPSRLTKAVEGRAIAEADGIVVLTHRVRRRLFGEQDDPRVRVIPCCADLTALERGTERREARRFALELTDATVMLYLGKFGGWYMAAEMADFFATARELMPRLHFLILTQGDRTAIARELESRGISSGFTVTSAPPEEIGDYLAASDFGISFIRPSISKESSSPTKVGEYLAGGLPVITTADVGDLNSLITPGVGTLVRRHTPETYEAAARALIELLQDPGTPGRCRRLAERELSLDSVGVPRYDDLYRRVASSISTAGSYATARARVRARDIRSPRS